MAGRKESRTLLEGEHATLLWNVNTLLAAAGISAKKVKTITELLRVSSSMFVAIFESIFKKRLENVIRGPRVKEDYVHNVQRVIDSLAEVIGMDMPHLTGRSVCKGDIRSLNNLVNLFLRIISITGQDSVTKSTTDDFVGEGDIESISTRESTFHDQHLRGGGQRSEVLFSPAGVVRSSHPANSSKDNRLRSSFAATVDDSTEQVMLRSVYSGLLRSMYTWHNLEHIDAFERIRRLRSETRAAIQALHTQFDERVRLLKEQARSTNAFAETHDKAQQRVLRVLKNSYSSRQQRMLQTQTAVVRQLRQAELLRGREANKTFQSFQDATGAEL